LKNLRVFRRV